MHDIDSPPPLAVRIERERSALRVTAQSRGPLPSVLQVTFSGGPERICLRITQSGITRVLSPQAIARHPALSAISRLIADEVEMQRTPNQELLAFLFRSLLVYAHRMTTEAPLAHLGQPARDTRVEKALELLNADISKRWTVELLARAVGLSRPAFARRFLRALRLSPMRYLTQRRMQLAAALLLGSDAALAEIASQVGYQSEFAFSRAFKRHHGLPPTTYRQPRPTALHRSHAIRMAA